MTMNRTAPGLRMPRQAVPVNRAAYSGAMVGGPGIEAADFWSWLSDAGDWLEGHPALLATLAALVLL